MSDFEAIEFNDAPVSFHTPTSASLIPNLPSSAYYIPNFITPTEEDILLRNINNAPLPTWKSLSHRRLQAHPFPLSSANTLIAAPLPSWLTEPIIARLLSLSLRGTQNESNTEFGIERTDHEVPQAMSTGNIFSGSPHGTPNHCLVNEYLPGQGIYPHEDGSAYWPIVCTVSLGSHTVLNITPKRSTDDDTIGKDNEQQKWRILQERRSLLISAG